MWRGGGELCDGGFAAREPFMGKIQAIVVVQLNDGRFWQIFDVVEV